MHEDLLAGPLEAPDNREFFRSQLQKVKNRAKHLEISLEQNRKRSTTICRECFHILGNMEMLGFDMLITEYFLGNASSKQVFSYIDSCLRLQALNLASGDPRETEKCAEHIRDVQIQIQSTLNLLDKSDSKKIDGQRRTGDIIGYMKDQIQKLELDLQRGYDELKTQGSLAQPVTVRVEIPASAESKPLEISSEFSAWMKKFLKPGAASIDQETAELRALFGTCVHRIRKIHILKEQIYTLKNTTMSTQNLQYSDCDPDAIYGSPWYQSVQGSSKFLEDAVKYIHEEQQLIPACMEQLEVGKQKLLELQEKCAETVTQTNQYKEHLENNLYERRAAVNQLKMELVNAAEAMCFNIDELKLPEVIKTINDLEEDIKKRLESAMMTDQNRHDKETRDKIQHQLDILDDLKKKKMETMEICAKSVDIIKSNIADQNELFTLVAEHFKSEEIVRLHQREMEEMGAYQQHLTTIIEFLNNNRITIETWCQQLSEVSQVLAESIAKQKEINKMFEPLLEQAFGDDEIAKMNEELDGLIDTNRKLVEEEAVLQLESAEVEEELFQVMQEIEAYKEWIGNDDNDDRVKEYEAMIKCPKCRSNRRECIFMTCFHPLCRRCMEASKGSHACPICDTPFTDDAIKPFHFQ